MLKNPNYLGCPKYRFPVSLGVLYIVYVYLLCRNINAELLRDDVKLGDNLDPFTASIGLILLFGAALTFLGSFLKKIYAGIAVATAIENVIPGGSIYLLFKFLAGALVFHVCQNILGKSLH